MADLTSLENLLLDNITDELLEPRKKAKLLQHAIDESLKPVDRALAILKNGDELQKLSVMEQLASLLETEDRNQVIDNLMPSINKLLGDASIEIHFSASITFLQILQENVVPLNIYEQIFLRLIINNMGTENQMISIIWLDTLIEVLDKLTKESIRDYIIPVISSKSGLSMSKEQRSAACQILGKICSRRDVSFMKDQIVNIVFHLCGDVLWEIRACMCKGLYNAGPFIAESPNLIAVLGDLVHDENNLVQIAALESIVQALPNLSKEVLRSRISPLIIQICKDCIQSDFKVMSSVVKNLGKLCIGIESLITIKDRGWFLSFYHTMSILGISPQARSDENMIDTDILIVLSVYNNEQHQEIREHCALNYYLMARFFLGPEPTSSSQILNVLYSILKDFVLDPQPSVRCQIARTISEIADSLGPSNARLIKNALVKLLGDKSIEVLKELTPHINKVLLKLVENNILKASNPDFKNEAAANDISSAIILCEDQLAKQLDWRLYCTFLEQLEVLPQCFDSDLIFNVYTSRLLISRLGMVQALPRIQALGHLILVLLQYNKRTQQPLEIHYKLVDRFVQANNCYTRMTYLQLCKTALKLLPRTYFKAHFFDNVLKLAGDPVGNVRLMAVDMLPELKSMLRIPADREKQKELENVVGSLMCDFDREVVARLRTIITKLDSIEVHIEIMPGSVSSNPRYSTRPQKPEVALPHSSTRRKK